MGKFVYVYTGGATADTPEAQEAVMQAWIGWFGTLGPAVADGGNPFGASASVGSGGPAGASGIGLGGYSIVTADSLEHATELAAGCPVLQHGGTVEVYEALPM